MKSISALAFLMIISTMVMSQQQTKPLRIGVVGLVHTHVHWILGRPDLGDIEIVGIVEPNLDLAKQYAEQHGYSMDIVYTDLEAMLDAKKPEAVTVFTTIYDHLRVTEICAKRGIHIMVEKPLAVSLKHAKKMETLAKTHNIELLTNYETTWYGSNHKAYQMAITEGKIGDLRKVVVHDGHQGPIEIGCNIEFLEWLTDPVLNGGGAITDFGCYGANLITWLMQGKRPISVFAVKQQIKPDKYPKVDDEATIVVEYKDAQGIIEASWNWPYNRKDMEVYGVSGYIHADNRTDMRIFLDEKDGELKYKAAERDTPLNDPFSYFKAVIRKEITPSPYDLSSLENNMLVMEILEAAKKSAEKGKRVKLSGN